MIRGVVQPDTAANVPTDADALRAPVLSTIAERDTWTTEHNVLLARNERLHHVRLKLNRLQFGRRSERLDADQLQLGSRTSRERSPKTRPRWRIPALREERATKRPASRDALLAYLTRVEITLLLEDTAAWCDDRDRHGQFKAARRGAGAVSGAGDASSEAGVR